MVGTGLGNTVLTDEDADGGGLGVSIHRRGDSGRVGGGSTDPRQTRVEEALVIREVVVDAEAELASRRGERVRGSDATTSGRAGLDAFHERVDVLLLQAVPDRGAQGDQAARGLHDS